MERLARRVGLGLAARGEVDEVVSWAWEARRAGLDSVWLHDSYFERDAVTYVSAIASELGADESEDGFRIALGAVNPFTRHPVVLAMTGSALDEMAPGRIVLGMGTGLPLRLKQMGIPYAPNEAVGQVSRAIDQIRTLWAGERLPSATEGLPPIQPMFAPPHRIPIVIAAYRKEFVALAGEKADGYLARPAESINSLRGNHGPPAPRRGRCRTCGRDGGGRGLPALACGQQPPRGAQPRQARAVRDLHDERPLGYLPGAGRLRTRAAGRIAAAWRAEEFHTAAGLIPDELLDAFMLCGTRDQVAIGALRFHEEAGLDLPLLQPVVQEKEQVAALLDAAGIFARIPEGAREPTAAPAPGGEATRPAGRAP